MHHHARRAAHVHFVAMRRAAHVHFVAIRHAQLMSIFVAIRHASPCAAQLMQHVHFVAIRYASVRSNKNLVIHPLSGVWEFKPCPRQSPN